MTTAERKKRSTVGPSAASDGQLPTLPLGGQAPTSYKTVEERRARGHDMREKTPRSSHAFWAEPADRPDPVSLLEAEAASRQANLIPIRYARMSVSPFTFLRGSAGVMASDLAHTPTTGIQTQLCGDCHLSNFGGYASPERSLLFDINDFDETLPGPWEWDIKRLAASFHVAGRGNGFAEAECRDAVLSMVRSYRQHMAEFSGMRQLDVWYARINAEDFLGAIANKQLKKRTQERIKEAHHRDSMQVFAKMTEVVDGHRLIVNDPPLVMRVTEDQLGAELRTIFDLYTQSLRGAQQRVLERFELVDAALKVVGVGSVGTRCFIVLLLGRDDNDPLFLQVKEAQESVLQAHLTSSEFQHQGQRVVAGQELMQSASDIFLGWMTGPAGRHFYVRQLRDMKVSAEVESMSATDLSTYATVCGWALARAHARAGDAIQIAAYLGTSERFDYAVASFAEAYANQNERDYQAFLHAIKTGRLVAATAV